MTATASDGVRVAGANEVAVEPVRFRAVEAMLIGNLFLPSGRHDGAGLPAAVVSGTWTSVKEQIGDRYAAKLAMVQRYVKLPPQPEETDSTERLNAYLARRAAT
jgi:hypothetical protein